MNKIYKILYLVILACAVATFDLQVRLGVIGHTGSYTSMELFLIIFVRIIEPLLFIIFGYLIFKRPRLKR